VTSKRASSSAREVLALAPSVMQHCFRHPLDVAVIVSAAWNLRRRHWWRYAPFLPLPGPQYWDFRMKTLNGDTNVRPDVDEIVAAAKWAKAQRASR